jgi:hypothetical protein
MVALRTYSLETVQAAAQALRQDLERGVITAPEFWLEQNLFRFRDGGGHHWYLDVRANRWHCFGEGVWQEAGPAPARLEGVAATALERALVTEEGALGDETGHSSPEGPGPEILTANVRRLRQAYARGWLPSTDVEDVLREQYFVDRDGAFWTVGLCSGRWYRWEEAEWVRVKAPPAADTLLEAEPARCPTCGELALEDGTCPNCGEGTAVALPDVPEEVYARIFAFALVGNGSLPEPLTDPWEPPDGFPGADRKPDLCCDACQTLNPPGHRFCRACGAPLTCPTCGASLAPPSEVAPPPVAPVRCPRCNALLAAGRKFCTQCGTHV